MPVIKNILILFVLIISSKAMSSEVIHEIDDFPMKSRMIQKAITLKEQYLKIVYGIKDQFSLTKQTSSSILSPLHKNPRRQIEDYFKDYIATNRINNVQQLYLDFLTQPQIPFSNILNKVAYLHAELGDWADRLYFENTGKIGMFIENLEPAFILIRYCKCYSSPDLITASDDFIQNCSIIMPPKFFMHALDFLQRPEFLEQIYKDTTRWDTLGENLELLEKGMRTPYPWKPLAVTVAELCLGLQDIDPETPKDHALKIIQEGVKNTEDKGRKEQYAILIDYYNK